MKYAAQPDIAVAPQGFLQRVFTWMFAGLLITAGAAAVIGANVALLEDVTDSPGLLIGLFVAQIVVAIFAALTAYDMQKLKRYAAAGASSGGAAIRAALALYLDFINLFLFLLRIFGRR